jgi:outer membrane receptor protein involved in Fe transport
MSRNPLRLILTLLALLSATVAHAQDKGAIAGKVTDRKTQRAIPFASVTVMGARLGGLTDSEGIYRIGNVPPGSYEVRIQFLGYSPASKQITVAAGRTETADFALDEIVVRQEKVVEVTAERALVEVKQGATIRSVNAAEIRNLPVQTISDVLQQQAGISTENDQIHVRGGRADETIFVVNGVANRDLVTGQSTAGELNARSVAEVNVATGAYDVRYGNALSGVVEVRLKEGGDRFSGGLTTTAGSHGGRSFQLVLGGPDPVLQPLARRLGLQTPGTLSALVDLSGTLYDTRFWNLGGEPVGMFDRLFEAPERPRLRSSYEDSFFGKSFRYGDFFTPAADNKWAARLSLTYKPGERDKFNFNFSKRIAIDQGFSRTFINATGDLQDPAYPWRWANRIANASTFFEDNVQGSLQWRRTLGTTGYSELQLSRYFFAQRQDVLGKHWSQYEEPDDFALSDPTKREDYFIDSGDDDTWQDRRTNTWALSWNGVQRVKRHEIELGFEHQSQSVQYVTVEDPWIFDPSGLGSAHDVWKVHPWVGNLYLRDKLEYEGFTANVGLRWDYWFLGKEAERAIADLTNPNITEETRRGFYDDTNALFGRRYKSVLSPRVIVAHPITESSSFFFNYGRFTQNPSYRYVYSKLTSVSSEAFPLLGNPNLNPQVSVNYEVGAKHQFLPTSAVNLTFFVKDVYDYPTATTFQRQQGDTLVDIFVYLNGHFARAKGFEIELEKRRSNNWSGKLAYTFQQTKGKSSDANEQRIVEEAGGDAAETRLSETFVRWNRPHKLTAHFDLRFPEQGPERFPWMARSGINIYVQGQSGRPYTPVDPVTDLDIGEPFSKNAPFQVTSDIKVNHWFTVGGRRLDLALAALNAFDNRLIYRVDRITGEGRVWGVGQYDPNRSDVDDFTYVSQVLDPSNYGPGRQWRLSLDYDF